MNRLVPGQSASNYHYLPRLFTAGALASLCMTLVVYLGPFLGIPNVDFAAMLGSLLVGGAPRIFSSPWWAGMAWHLINGAVIFPLLFGLVSTLFAPRRSVSHPLVKGLLCAGVLWLLCQATAMPIVGGGFFSDLTSDPLQVVLGSLLAHLVYGITLSLASARAVTENVQLVPMHKQAA